MSRSPARIALITIPAIEVLGFLSGLASNSGFGNPWFDALVKPAVMPPGWLFPVAWTTLYALMGLALALVLATPPSRARRVATGLFAGQLVLNLAWSPVFFGMNMPQTALAIIIAMLALAVLATLAFRRVRPAAAALMLPYLGWLLFAAYLNAEIIRLN